MPHSATLVTLFSLILATISAGATPLFEDSAVIEAKLSGPLSTLINKKNEHDETLFTLTVGGVEHAVKVRIRGKSRLDVCRFPPLRINFNKRDTVNTIFAGQDKLKLVTSCKDNAKSQADLLEEYAAYRLFTVISDTGYRVRLLRIHYVDTDKPQSGETNVQYGFFIEPVSTFEKRHDATRVKTKALNLGSLDLQHTARVFIFQYLIANTDWSLVMADLDDECCHNGDLYQINGQRYYVPYDFDLSGLVDAPYAKPDPSLRLSRVTKRRYRGYCIPGEPLEQALQAIVEMQPKIMAELEQVPGLTAKQIESRQHFLQGFFRVAQHPAKLLARFEKRCL